MHLIEAYEVGMQLDNADFRTEILAAIRAWSDEYAPKDREVILKNIIKVYKTGNEKGWRDLQLCIAGVAGKESEFVKEIVEMESKDECHARFVADVWKVLAAKK